MGKSCCVTGRRRLPVSQIKRIKEEHRREIEFVIKDGYAHFISGMAEGVDLYFAGIITEIKVQNSDITLEAAIPRRKRLDAKDSAFQRLIKLCDTVHVTLETFNGGVYMNRNMYMVGKCERIIAVYDGRDSGGTAFTIRYARTREREINIITLEQE